MRSTCESAEALFQQAASAAIDRAGLAPADIDGVVTVSTTGIATPSLEARVAVAARASRRCRAGCRCSGSAAPAASAGLPPRPGWRRASRAAAGCSSPSRPARSRSGSTATTRRRSSPLPCSATAPRPRSLRAASPGSPESPARREKLWPDTQRIMGWDIEDPGLAVVFDRAIPPFIERELAPAVDSMLAAMGVDRAATRPFLLPPRRRQGHRRDRKRRSACRPASSTWSAKSCATMAT